jgi:hypothetical protein
MLMLRLETFIVLRLLLLRQMLVQRLLLLRRSLSRSSLEQLDFLRSFATFPLLSHFLDLSHLSSFPNIVCFTSILTLMLFASWTLWIWDFGKKGNNNNFYDQCIMINGLAQRLFTKYGVHSLSFPFLFLTIDRRIKFLDIFQTVALVCIPSQCAPSLLFLSPFATAKTYDLEEMKCVECDRCMTIHISETIKPTRQKLDASP